MIRNYFVVALRNLLRRKSYTLLNLGGLTLGVVSCTIVFILLQFEFSFDTFHNDIDRIYRVVRHTTSEAEVSKDTGAPFPMGKALRDDGAPAQEIVQVLINNDYQIDVLDASMNDTGKRFNEKGAIGFIEPGFFRIFNFPWVMGDPETTLIDPNAVAVTEEMAVKYYGTPDNAINKYLRAGAKKIYRITGIIKNIPSHSDFPLKIVFAYQALGNNLPGWDSTNSDAQVYFKLGKGQSPEDFASMLTTITKKYVPMDSRDSYHIQALSDIHFNLDFGNYRERVADKEMLKIFGLIGLFILVISCINFVNMALAKAFQRSKEVGIRKSLGGARGHLMTLYLSETALLVFTALVLGVVVTQLILPVVGPLVNLPADVRWVTDPLFIAFLAGVFILVTLLSGVYPALRTSSFKPAQALKDGIQASVGGFPLRKVLIVVQFFIAQGLIFCMIVITNQTSYFQNTSLGFNKEAIVTVAVPNDSTSRTGREPFRNRMLTSPAIKNVSFSYSSPASRGGNWWTNFTYNRAAEDAPEYANLKWAEPEFFKTYGLELVAGHMYASADSMREVIVNERLLASVGVTNPEDAIGRTVRVWDKHYPIAGVVKDFHIYGLRNELLPVIMAHRPEFFSRLNVGLDPNQIKEGLAAVESTFRETYPNQVFEFEFVDETVANFYRQEEKFTKLFWIFAGMAITIGSLGLFGMVSLSVLRRTKEIGVRKVLGASLQNLVTLLSQEFMILVLIASLLALPLGWWLMSEWLKEFEYQISIGWEMFATSVVSTMIIAWLALSFQTIKAALANPVNALRNE